MKDPSHRMRASSEMARGEKRVDRIVAGLVEMGALLHDQAGLRPQ